MTARNLLTALLPLVSDLSRELPESERYRRLLHAMRALLPCDAAALLRLDGEWLVPLAVDGLSMDTLGRRFKVAEHPRFAALLSHAGPTRFDSDCALPDPYDGLIQGLHADLRVHDCLGCPLQVDERTWGLLTLDALDPERFEPIELDALQAFASLASATVSVVSHIERLANDVENQRQRADAYRQASDPRGPAMIGQSAALARLSEEIRWVGASDMTVLIAGETGVGKELVAHALHQASARAGRPMITVNCAALPETLVESELFGHVRGAFTGATSDRSGKFELANGATLFLDEVGELSLAVQAKLLRVLQSGQLQRLGSDREHRVDVRLIAATNRNLKEEVEAGRYRADFYHRLSAYPLQVPPLRERGSDILLLSGYFLEQNRSRVGVASVRLSADAQAALLDYEWPGNIRELEHLMGRSTLKALRRQGAGSRAAILTIGASDLDLPGSSPRGVEAPAQDPAATLLPVTDLRCAMERHQKTLIQAALSRHQGAWAPAARELGVDRANLARMARRLGLK